MYRAVRDDDTGGLVGFEVTHDAEWLPQDLRAALEWQAEQDLLCKGCGHPRDETMRDETDPDAPKWRSEAVVCHACADRQGTIRAAHDDAEGTHLDGWYWAVEKVPPG